MQFKKADFTERPVVIRIAGLTVETPADEPARILDGIDIVVREGETACIVGESGSGKSVTSLAVMGLIPKDALRLTGGCIELAGTELLGLRASVLRDLRASKVSMIFQEPMTALNPVMRVGAQITEVLDIHTILSAAEKKDRVLDIMRQVQLPDVERIYKCYPHQLSGGQRQRIMIAMALILEPKLLIADEPTTALDVTTQNEVLRLIAELQVKNNTAVLFITHDMGVVAEIADTVYVMRHGTVVESAPTEELLRNPREDYTRKLLQSVPSLTPRPPNPQQDAEVYLDVSALGKIYGGKAFEGGTPVRAATDVSFSIAKGRTLGIVGESGSGKSTVARCIMRLIDPSEGEIVVRGTDIATLGRRALKPHRKNIQIVFQDPYRSLNPRWRIGRSLTEGPMNFGLNRRQAYAQAADLMELVGLPKDALGRYPHEFSGGQRQRIAIARAVAMRPDILVADEAVSALDVSVQAQVLGLLDDLQKKLGIAILFITHDLRVAAQICDDVIVMKQGKVVEQDTALNVLQHPKHPYTKQLIDAAPGRGWDFARCHPFEPNAMGGEPVESQLPATQTLFGMDS